MTAIAFASLAFALAIGLYALSQDMMALNERPVRKWNPDLGDSIDLAQQANQTDPSEVFARPIFSPTRRPFVAAPQPSVEPQPEPLLAEPPQAQPPSDPAQLQLKGVLEFNGAARALLLSPDQPNGVWLRPGEAIMGWEIKRIEANAVVLATAGQEFTLKQYVDNSGAGLGTEPPTP